MRLILALLGLLLSLASFANDGVYLTNGSLIYPTKETKIALDKEVLSFTIKDERAYVDIQFEFNNPENVARKLMVGFQAPTAGGDVSDDVSNSNQIDDFTIIQNGRILPYEVKAALCEDCELKEPEEFHFSQFENGIFVFLFEMTFEPGLNRITHSYSFPASRNVSFDQIYNYILRTGSKWASRKIKDLTINIDMGKNSFFFVHDIFGQGAKWSHIGAGKVTDKRFDYYDSDSCRMVRTLNGYLQIQVADYQPTKNIEFGIVNNDSFVCIPLDYEKLMSKEVVSLGHMQLESSYSASQLRLKRNTVYAQYGYAFKSADLRSYFSQFAWYMPDPNLKMEDIKLSEKEKNYIEKIRIKELSNK
ncbi:MAG: YARHG domain-containing protein [Bacteroidota bacterium]